MGGTSDVGVVGFGKEIRGKGAAGGEPGFDLEGADIHVGDGGEVDPVEVDAGFLGLDLGAEVPTADRIGAGSGGGEFDAVQLFHVEHQVDFVVVALAVVESVFGGEE